MNSPPVLPERSLRAHHIPEAVLEADSEVPEVSSVVEKKMKEFNVRLVEGWKGSFMLAPPEPLESQGVTPKQSQLFLRPNSSQK